MNSLAKANAVKLLKDLYITSPEKLVLENIAGMNNLFIEERDLTGKEGELVYKEGCGVMSIDSKIAEKGQKRYTTAHELGQDYNDNVPEQNKGRNKFYFSCSGEDIRSIYLKNPREANANDFAAELLMPEEWFKKFTMGKRFNKKLLADTAEYFNTSLSAAALRYAEIGNHPTAIIMSSEGKVKWKKINSYFPFQWIEQGQEVNNNSYA